MELNYFCFCFAEALSLRATIVAASCREQPSVVSPLIWPSLQQGSPKILKHYSCAILIFNQHVSAATLKHFINLSKILIYVNFDPLCFRKSARDAEIAERAWQRHAAIFVIFFLFILITIVVMVGYLSFTLNVWRVMGNSITMIIMAILLMRCCPGWQSSCCHAQCSWSKPNGQYMHPGDHIWRNSAEWNNTQCPHQDG